MATIRFENPNFPEQPSKGVYRWYYCEGSVEITIYVGCAGNRSKTVGAPSTLKRGIQEAQRSCVTSNKGKHLDTDFVVGTALIYLKQQGHDCIWQHISDDPKEERKFCEEFQPLLQTRKSTIYNHFRLRNPCGTPWTGADVEVAERHLIDSLRKHLVRNGTVSD